MQPKLPRAAAPMCDPGGGPIHLTSTHRGLAALSTHHRSPICIWI